MSTIHADGTSGTAAPRAATSTEARPLAAVLATAFLDDPVIRWAFPDPERRRILVPGFLEVDVVTGLEDGRVDTTDVLDGAAVWFPLEPSGGPDSGGSELVDARLAAAEECHEAVACLTAFIGELTPTVLHYTLELIGTLPRRQGNGLGSALLAPGLARCDREGVPAHLWSSNFRNLAFYERHGFRVVREEALPGGPPIWQMWREPR